MMCRVLEWLVTRIALVGFCMFPTVVMAQVQWNMATEYPASSISGIGLATFEKLVAQDTHGFVKTVNSFEMKIGSGDLPRATQDHRVDGGDAFSGPLESSDPIFGLPSLPFVVQSIAAAKTVNERARPLYARALAERGLRLLYITIWPATGIWSDRALNNPEDLRTLSVRTYDKSSTEVWRTVGATAEFLPFSEVLAKIRDHRLNAVLTSGDGGAGRKLWDDLHHFTPINYAIPISIAFVRHDDFSALPKEVQDQVEAAAAETENSQFELLANRTAENYQRMRANGVSIDEPAPPEVIAVLKKAASAPIAIWQARVSTEAVAILDSANRQ